jgi:hypothetical protein
LKTSTFADLAETFGSTGFATDFPADLDIPVLAGPQCQGDVSICPAHLYGAKPQFGQPLPVDGKGVEVIRGGAMNNAHTLRALGTDVTWRPATRTGETVALGLLTVPDGAEVFLEHPEHGFNGIAPGSYVVGRQREQAEAVRLVAD